MQLQFNDIEVSIVYVADTSAFIKLDTTFPKNSPTFTAVWEEIEELINHSRFRTIDFVEDEINNYEGKEEFLKKWFKAWKKKLIYNIDEETVNASIPIINEEYNTGFFDAKKQAEGKEEADPYLIAYCKVRNYILITNENKNKPNKIPGVSRKHNVKCIDVYDFLLERELKMERKKK